MYKQTILLSLFALTAVSQATSLEDMGRYYQLIKKHKTDAFMKQLAQGKYSKDKFMKKAVIMHKKGYYDFIAPFILEAEASLEIMSSFKKDGVSKKMESLARSYFELLTEFKLQALRAYLSLNPIYVSYHLFHWKIEEIKKAKNLYSLDVDKEVKKTFSLLREVNKAFYNKLSFLQRSTLSDVACF